MTEDHRRARRPNEARRGNSRELGLVPHDNPVYPNASVSCEYSR